MTINNLGRKWFISAHHFWVTLREIKAGPQAGQELGSRSKWRGVLLTVLLLVACLPSAQPSWEDGDPQTLWIFGCSFLVWKLDFPHSDSCVGFVCGYSCQFWQEDTFLRGSGKMPSRVTTLFQDREGCTGV